MRGARKIRFALRVLCALRALSYLLQKLETNRNLAF